MPNDIVEEVRRTAERSAIEAAWVQWSALTSLAVPLDRPPHWSIVDPEALVLTSLAMSPLERRLEDVLAAWSRTAGFLHSKPRFKRLVVMFPDAVAERLGDFARYAARGGESRWRAWASRETPEGPSPRDKRMGPLKLVEGPTLMLRLRAGFGVNAKADILSILLGFHGVRADVKVLAAASGYTERMVRTATREMVLARFIYETDGHPSTFYARHEPWAHVLEFVRLDGPDPGGPSIPPWRFWSAALGFLCSVALWGQRAHEDSWSDYVAASKARDIYEAHVRRLRQAGLELDGSGHASGEEYLPSFRDTVGRVASWVAQAL